MLSRRNLLKSAIAASGAVLLDRPRIGGQPLLWTPERQLITPEAEVIEEARPGWAFRGMVSDVSVYMDMIDATSLHSLSRTYIRGLVERTVTLRIEDGFAEPPFLDDLRGRRVTVHVADD